MSLQGYPHRLRILAPVAVTAVLLAVLAVGTWHLEVPRRSTTAHGEFKGIVTPGLTRDQVLDRSLSAPGVRGIVRGVVGSATVVRLPDPDSVKNDLLATNFSFQVESFLGKGPSPYPPGARITLRVPGGTLGGQTFVEEDGPRVHPGQELYVFVIDLAPVYTTRWGQNSNSVLVAVDNGDVFEVVNGVVRGQGLNANLAEPVATFESHFGVSAAAPPASTRAATTPTAPLRASQPLQPREKDADASSGTSSVALPGWAQNRSISQEWVQAKPKTAIAGRW